MSTSINDSPIGLKLGRDTNGNQTIKVKFPNSDVTGFSVQTLGTMPQTHMMTEDSFSYKIAIVELEGYIRRFGTLKQREATGFSL
jgi:hypothetical protein